MFWVWACLLTCTFHFPHLVWKHPTVIHYNPIPVETSCSKHLNWTIDKVFIKLRWTSYAVSFDLSMCLIEVGKHAQNREVVRFQPRGIFWYKRTMPETVLRNLESEAISPPYGCHLQSKASPIVFHASFSHLSRFHYTFHISCFTNLEILKCGEHTWVYGLETGRCQKSDAENKFLKKHHNIIVSF